MDRENKTAVANAFGMMDGLLGDVDGVFGYERAFFQGACSLSSMLSAFLCFL